MSEYGPESWKVKCGIRPADALPMTDGGTLIMRTSPAAASSRLSDTRDHHTPSIAPFAIDLAHPGLDFEDDGEPARNGDAFGQLRRTTSFDAGRTTTTASFWSGLVAGVTTLGIGLAIAVTAFTAEASNAAAPRSPRVVAHVASSLSVETVESTDAKLIPKKKHRVRHVVASPTGDEASSEVSAPSPEPQPSESE